MPETPGIQEITTEIIKITVTRGTHVLQEIPMIIGTVKIEILTVRKILTKKTLEVMEEIMAEKRVLELKQGTILEMNLEMKVGVTGRAGVEAEVQNCWKREVEEQEDLKLMDTVVVETTMRAGNLEVDILRETVMMPGIKRGIHPLKEDMEKGTDVTTEREIQDQTHQYAIKEGVMNLSVMKEERNEG